MRSRRITLTLEHKVFGLVGFLVLALVGLMVGTLPEQRIDGLTGGLDRRATSYARMLSTALEPAIAFHDRQAARAALATLKADPEVLGAAVYGDDGALLAVAGISAADMAPGLDHGEVRLEGTGDELHAIAPIVPREGGRGVVFISISKASLARGRAEIYRTTGAIASISLALGLAGAWLIARGISNRIAAIARIAVRVADGDFDQPPIRDRSRDEVGKLAYAFDFMLRRINGLIADRERVALEEQSRLEELVRSRTDDLAKRTEEMGLVLANLSEGVVTIDGDGRMGHERSRAIDAWFGAPARGAKFSELIAKIDRSFANRFEIGWDAVVENWLPLELALEQLPDTFTVAARTYRVRVKPIKSPLTERRYLVVIADATADVGREREEAAHRDLAAALKQLAGNRQDFAEFVADARRRAATVCTKVEIDEELLRDLQSLKGSCRVVGQRDLAALCESIETAIDLSGERPPLALREALASRVQCLADALGDPPKAGLEIDPEEHAKLIHDLERGAPRSEILAFARALELEPAARHLERLGEQVYTLAERCHKEVDVVIEDAGLRVDRARWSPFWGTLVHAVRNAVVHGIESHEERIDRGKPSVGVVSLRARETPDRIFIEIADDGRGIAWEEIARAAAARGLPAKNRAELVSALCTPGFSLTTEVDDLAGRGEGLAALRSAVELLGGTLQVQSWFGSGSLFVCSFPIERARSSSHVELVA